MHAVMCVLMVDVR